MIFPASIILLLLCLYNAKVALADGSTELATSDENPGNCHEKHQDVNIFEAVRAGDISLVKEFYLNGSDIYKIDDMGLTVMHWAVLQGPEMVITLLENNFDINKDFQNGTSILSFAVTLGTTDMVKVLIEFGCIVDSVNEVDVTPFYEALILNRTDIAELLISYGANVNKVFRGGRTYLHKAVNDSNIRVAYQLINHGISVNVVDDEGKTALADAVQNCHPAMVNLLLKHGANVYGKVNGESYLNLAARNNCDKIVEILLKNNMKPDAMDATEYSPIYWAVRYDNVVALSILKLFGSDVNARFDDSENSLLHVAAAYGSTKAIQWLLQKGLYVNDRNKQGATPLHFAAGYDQPEAITVLYENGAYINARDIFDRTPLYWARYWAHDQAIILLLSYGGGL